jgi:hypothetical protein
MSEILGAKVEEGEEELGFEGEQEEVVEEHNLTPIPEDPKKDEEVVIQGEPIGDEIIEEEANTGGFLEFLNEEYLENRPEEEEPVPEAGSPGEPADTQANPSLTQGIMENIPSVLSKARKSLTQFMMPVIPSPTSSSAPSPSLLPVKPSFQKFLRKSIISGKLENHSDASSEASEDPSEEVKTFRQFVRKSLIAGKILENTETESESDSETITQPVSTRTIAQFKELTLEPADLKNSQLSLSTSDSSINLAITPESPIKEQKENKRYQMDTVSSVIVNVHHLETSATLCDCPIHRYKVRLTKPSSMLISA